MTKDGSLSEHLEQWLHTEYCRKPSDLSKQEVKSIAIAASASKLSVGMLAEIIQRSRRQTYRIIHRSFERPEGKLLSQLELQKAVFLLKARNFKTIKELMNSIDWNNQHYFTSVFEAEFGLHPKKKLTERGG